ncbi:MAG: OmpH family outer membrane protein [Bacteroidota bacterium]|nr:OmpH family outer membrane protein [Bacteroidota bacterium]
MRKITFILVSLLVLSLQAYSQKFGYVDTNYILNKMPDYKKAQDEINKLSLGWQDEIQNQLKEIQGMYDALNAEEVLLTAEMKNDRVSVIKKKEQEVKEYQKKIFGFEGMFFLKKKELVKPVQDEVFDAVKKVAETNRLQIVFDKSGDLVMIYTDPIHDYTDMVLEDLGLGDPIDVIK